MALSAECCPSCGAQNSWIHPKIRHFLNIKDTINIDEFEYKYDKTNLQCIRPKSSFIRQLKLMHIGIAINLAAVLVMFVNMSYGSLILLIGVSFVAIGVLFGGVSVNSYDYIHFNFDGEHVRYETNNVNIWKRLVSELN